VSNYWIGDAAGRVLGPLSLQALRELLGSGRLKAATRASRDGRTWEPLDRLQEVKDLLGAPPPDAALRQAEHLRERLRGMRSVTAQQLFGLQPTTSLDELRTTFFKMARRFTPENHGPQTPPALRQANAEAYDFLSRRMREAEAWLQANRAGASGRAGQAAVAPPVRTYAAEEFVGLQQREDRLQVTIRVSPRTLGIFTEHRIINLQAGGLFIPTPTPLRLGTRVELVLQFEQPERQIKLRSSVIWEYSQEDSRQPRGYGLGLADLRGEERSFLEEYLRGARASAPALSS
jgi:uncharacterized protein (TIGR02266 family)